LHIGSENRSSSGHTGGVWRVAIGPDGASSPVAAQQSKSGICRQEVSQKTWKDIKAGCLQLSILLQTQMRATSLSQYEGSPHPVMGCSNRADLAHIFEGARKALWHWMVGRSQVRVLIARSPVGCSNRASDRSLAEARCRCLDACLALMVKR